jgi:hypothetical protein
MLKGKKLPSSPHSSLDFIQDQESSGFITAFPERPQEGGLSSSGTSFSLYCFNNYGCCFGCNRLHSFRVVEVTELNARHKWPEVSLEAFASRYTQGSVGTSMIGTAKRYNLSPGQFQAAFYGLAARVHKVDTFQGVR